MVKMECENQLPFLRQEHHNYIFCKRIAETQTQNYLSLGFEKACPKPIFHLKTSNSPQISATLRVKETPFLPFSLQ